MNVALMGYKNHFNNNVGTGISKYMYSISKSLLKIRNTDYNIKIVPFSNRYNYFFALNSKTLKNYDILHNLTYGPTLPFNKNGRIFITTVHDFRSILDYKFLAGKNLEEKILSSFWGPLGSRLALFSDYLIANSTLTKADAIKLGFSKENIFVTNLGIDNKFSSGSINNAKKDFKIGYLGGSDLLNLTKCFNTSVTDHDIYLSLWGRSSTENKLFAIASKDKRIVLNGFIPENKKVEVYDSFSVFISLTKYEGFGFPILEAQARGIPVIIYKDAKIPKEVKKYCIMAKDEFEMFELAKKIKGRGYNNDLRIKMMKYARSFTWEKCARETLEVYKKVLG